MRPAISQTGSNSDEWLPAKPGSEGILALAMARAAIESGAGAEQHAALLAGVLADADLESAAERTGLPAETIARLGRAMAMAERAVEQLLTGSAALLRRTGDPARLRSEVTSPGGTTAAGVRALEAHAVRAAFADAVRAAGQLVQAMRGDSERAARPARSR